MGSREPLELSPFSVCRQTPCHAEQDKMKTNERLSTCALLALSDIADGGSAHVSCMGICVIRIDAKSVSQAPALRQEKKTLSRYTHQPIRKSLVLVN